MTGFHCRISVGTNLCFFISEYHVTAYSTLDHFLKVCLISSRGSKGAWLTWLFHSITRHWTHISGDVQNPVCEGLCTFLPFPKLLLPNLMMLQKRPQTNPTRHFFRLLSASHLLCPTTRCAIMCTDVQYCMLMIWFHECLKQEFVKYWCNMW